MVSNSAQQQESYGQQFSAPRAAVLLALAPARGRARGRGCPGYGGASRATCRGMPGYAGVCRGMPG